MAPWGRGLEGLEETPTTILGVLRVSLVHQCSLKQAAILYTSYGWRLFPVSPGSNRPYFKDWPWQECATNDRRIIEDWWTRWPNCNIGFLTDDRVTVIDVDRHPGKPDGWATAGHLVDQGTPWVQTPGGGWHFYYQHHEGPLRQAPGVDIQRGLKYVVLPPSPNYTWGLEPGPPWDNGIRQLGEPLLELLRKPSTDFLSAEPQLDRSLPEISERPPEIPQHHLEPKHLAFLHHGHVVGFPSRSELIQSLATRLYVLGYDDSQVLSMLWGCPHVQDTALEHRRGSDDRGIQWLWFGLQKVRHHKRKAPEEVFKAAEASPEDPPGPGYDDLMNDALRLPPGGDCRELLQKVALAELDPWEEDQVISVIKVHGGPPKQTLTKLLKNYKDQARASRRPDTVIWKHTVGDDDRPLGTVENLGVLLESKSTQARHNLMDHRVWLQGDVQFTGEERFNSQLTQVRSWAAEARMPLETIKEQLCMLAQKQEYHPFREWVEKAPWDGHNRVHDIIETIQVEKEIEPMRDLLVRRWLVSIVAAVWGYGNRPPRGVLTFTGKQQMGKTTWLHYLVPKGMYHQGLILRPDQRDSATKGLRYLLVEIGEVGVTFRRAEIESLKNFIGQREDVWRLSYAHDESVWQRRTIFAASANSGEILGDQTGNSRWWVLPIKGFDLNLMEERWGDGWGEGLRQFWAEVHEMYKAGELWDLTDKELERLEVHLEDHMDVSPLEGYILDTYEWQAVVPRWGYDYPRKEKDIVNEIGWGRPLTPTENRLMREILRKLTGKDKTQCRRVRLASVDGKSVNPGNLDPERPGWAKAGRYWMMPALRKPDENLKPFRSV